MSFQLLIAGGLGAAGTASALAAVWCERQMHRHRRPGVTYLAATLRRDGGWRRDDLFAPEGLVWQRRAARLGMSAAALWLGGLGAWVAAGIFTG
jgi:hypothetical protein